MKLSITYRVQPPEMMPSQNVAYGVVFYGRLLRTELISEGSFALDYFLRVRGIGMGLGGFIRLSDLLYVDSDEFRWAQFKEYVGDFEVEIEKKP